MGNDVLVELYSKDECHLCEVAKEVLLKVRKQWSFRLLEIKIHPGMSEYDRMKERIPVVFVNKKFAFQHTVPEDELLRLLEEGSR